MSFDSLFHNPTQIHKYSSLGYSRQDIIDYHHDLDGWVLGQVKKQTNLNTGLIESRTEYDPATALPVQTFAFEKLQQTLTYNADGTVATVADGRGHTTALANWKRGIPQVIIHPDGASESATVDDNGWITSATDENGFTTNYGYDLMGRLASIQYPVGDSTVWNPVNISFNQIQQPDRGLPAGHWRQDRFEGNRHTHTYYDALWRPVMTLDYDIASAGHNAQTQTITRYDINGRVAFQSYPTRHQGDINANVPGVRTFYDALDRVTRVEQDSEHGVLASTTEYLPGNSVRTTNLRGHATTNHYIAYDQPAYELLGWSAQPEGRITEIHRDVFGKPLWMRQRTADNSVIAARHYVYDGYQQLCKSIEPETGATVMDYDAAGNVTWSANGLALPDTASCNRDAAYGSGRRINRTYDVRNRISFMQMPDNRGNQSWQYTPDGLLASSIVDNEGPGQGSVHNAYSYNKRRLLTGESVGQPGWYTWSAGYGYNGNGQLASQSYPDGFTLNFSPNALGQPTEVRDTTGKAYATGIGYYPNGALSQFTYGNGIVHTMQQNVRQLPARSMDSGGALDDAYYYDANANPTHIADELEIGYSLRDRWMAYDGLNRLTDAGSASFGGDHWHRFTYDALDNLKSWKLPGVKDYANYGYDANNRLTNIQNSAGSTVVGLGYDAQGNLANKNGQAYQFDFGNRLREVAGKEWYRYDGHGRRVLSWRPATPGKLSMYGQNGQLLRETDEQTGKKTNYLYLSGSLLAKTSTASPSPVPPAQAPALSVPAQSNNGSYSIGWTTVAGAERYTVEESAAGGAWNVVQDSAALAQAFAGKPANSYSYRVKACNAHGCGPLSATGVINVLYPPAAPGLSAPSSNTTGSFTVTWSGVAGATAYRLEQNANNAGWALVRETPALGADFSGMAHGTYTYRAQACNTAGCSGYSPEATVAVTLPPTAAPAITLPASSADGNYQMQWNAVAWSTTYQLEEQANGGAWQLIRNEMILSHAAAGKPDGTYAYRARGCNAVGCGPWSGVAGISVQRPVEPIPPMPATFEAWLEFLDTIPPSRFSTHLSWSVSPGATYYELRRNSNQLLYSGMFLEYEYVTRQNASYFVRACNSSGCSAWKGPLTR